MPRLPRTAGQELPPHTWVASGDRGFGGLAGRLRLPVWRTRDLKTRVLFWSLVALSVLLTLVIDIAITESMLSRGAAYVNSVFLFWGWSKFIHVISPAVLIYDPHALYAFEHGLVGAPSHHYPFAYPPSLLLLIWPLALASPVISLLLWFGISLALYAWACWHRPWGLRTVFLSLMAPSTVAALFCAQTSLLAAALVIGGCRVIGKRPMLAGVLFGLLTFKPQYGLLLPVALISARQWRSVIVATATALSMVVASGAAFGWAAWARLPSAMAVLSDLVARHPRFDHEFPTVTAGLRLLGASRWMVDAGQLTGAACAALAIWVCFRRGFTPLAAAALMVGAFMVTPYASLYDLPMVSYAVLAVVIERHQSRQPFGTVELLILVMAVALPVVMAFHPLGFPWGVTTLVLLFGVILRRIALLERIAIPGAA